MKHQTVATGCSKSVFVFCSSICPANCFFEAVLLNEEVIHQSFSKSGAHPPGGMEKTPEVEKLSSLIKTTGKIATAETTTYGLKLGLQA